MIDYLIHVFRNISRKKLRSILTILSIGIGVASVVLVGSIGNIGKDTITQEIESFGIGSLSVSVDTSKDSRAKLSEQQLSMIQTIPGVSDANPILMEYTQASMCGLTGSCVAWGVEGGNEQIISFSLLHGRLLDEEDVNACAKVCVLDENMAKAYYKRTNIVGKYVEIKLASGTEAFEVIGVVASGGNIMQNMLNNYIPHFVYLPYTTLSTMAGKENFDQIAVQVEDSDKVDQVGEKIIESLQSQGNIYAEAYRAENLFAQKQKLHRILDIVTGILSAVAAISLVVAGLGIMTIMLVSVNERTREIGIKKALGANKGKIMAEFVLESCILSLLGRGGGILVGEAVIQVGGFLFGVEVSPQIDLLLLVARVTVILGVAFGVYPALQAAKLAPVDALRFE